MDEIEERPSKIRKLDPSEDSKGASLNGADSGDVSSTTDIPGPSSASPDEREEGQLNDSQASVQDGPPLSKSQLKKLRKAEQWEAGKELRKAKRREKHKEKQARKAEQRAELQEKIANGEVEKSAVTGAQKRNRPRRPIQVPVAMILDCDFNELMTEKELISLGAQLTRCYSDNRTNPYRAHLAISSWGGKLQSRFETVLTNNHLGWKGVRFFDKDFIAAAGELDAVMRGPDGGKLVGALSDDKSKAVDEEKTETRSAFVPAESVDSNETYITAKSVIGTAEESSFHEGEVSTPVPQSNRQDGTIQQVISSELRSQKEEDAAPNIELESIEPGQGSTPDPGQTPGLKPEPSIVYLTSDSPHTLSTLSPNTSYIIGGIVDKNRHKGLCYKRACERGIPTAKLPIGEYMTMQSRTVLAINHVVEIMLKWLETGDWGEAFLSVIPKRKEAKLKVKKGHEQQGDGDGESEDEEDGETSLLEDKTCKLEDNEDASIE